MKPGSVVARVIAVLVFVFSSTSALALNTISLTSLATSPAVGDLVDVQVGMSFDDSTFGGGISLVYEPAVLSFESFVFDGSFTANFGIREPSAGSTTIPLEIEFGWFFVPSPIGDTPIGTFRFRVLAPSPATTVSAGAHSSSPFAGSVGSLAVDFGSTQLVVVPEPGSAILLLGGLGVMAVRRRSSSFG